MNSGNKYEVVIIGGGPAGAAAAIHLAQNNFDVCIIEKKKFPRNAKSAANGTLPVFANLIRATKMKYPPATPECWKSGDFEPDG